MKFLLALPALFLLTCVSLPSSTGAHTIDASAPRSAGNAPATERFVSQRGGLPRLSGDGAAVQDRAQKHEADGAWELARREWIKLDPAALDELARRFVLFRRADCAWRSFASTNEADDSDLVAAKKELEALQAAVERPELRDELWARVEEALGDFHWLPEQRQDWGQAWPRYSNALNWWGAAKDVEAARVRYLGMVWRMAWPQNQAARGAWYARQMPLDVLDNAVRIAVTKEDQARAQFLFSSSVKWNGASYPRTRLAFTRLESAIALGKGTPWYDDALWMLAEWNESPGKPDVGEDGQWTWFPDYLQALALYRRYVEEFKKGEAPQFDAARQAIERITRVEVSVATPCAFLPGSEAGFTLAWRNAASVELALHRVDLASATDLATVADLASAAGGQSWLAHVALAGRAPVKRWTHATQDAGKHAPGSAEVALEPALPEGAYVLEASAHGKTARELVLVGRTLVTVKVAGGGVLAWVCDALTSEPIANAKLSVWERFNQRDEWRWRRIEGVTGADGTFSTRTHYDANHSELLVLASLSDRQAVAYGGTGYRRGAEVNWRLYAVTDRPVYRPDGTVQWKVTARVDRDGRLENPAKQKLAYTIADPRGADVKQGELVLNAFGSAWAEFALDPSMSLGEYTVKFASDGNGIGGATLFRLEEYKLPEFEVTVATPEVDGKKKLYRVGERVEADLVARTYFGAPVGGADVEVIVWQRPWWRQWSEPREYPWCYTPDESMHWGRWNKGSQVTRLALKTDAEGKARVAFETPEGAGQDFEYTLEARVTDASRREIASEQVVRVTQKAYDVRAKLAHQIARPGDQVTVEFEARDANENPVKAEGRVKVERRRFVEVWIDPRGVPLSGAALELARSAESGVAFERRPGWRLKQSGYEHEEVASTLLSTNADGKASWTFPVARDGFYVVRWGGRDDRRQPITSEVSFWCADEKTRDTGWRSGPVELVLDKDTFKLGEKAPVMVSTTSSNRWVLLTLEGERIHSHQVVKVEGNAKLVMLDIGAELLPNFWISALTAADGEAASHTREVVVPPTPHFLSVELTPDAKEREPGAKGALSVLVKDARGEPAAAELTLSVVDEAVLALQAEYAGDPRPFFHGARREHWVQSHASTDAKSFQRLVRGKDGRLRDERQVWAEGADEMLDLAKNELDDRSGMQAVGGGGGGASGSRSRFDSKRQAASSAPMGNARSERMSLEANSPSDFHGGLLALGFVGGKPGESSGEPAVQVRSDFRETALWKPDLVTGADGRATVEFTYPESLTRWKLSARALTVDTRAGYATTTTRTQKPLTARLQMPRFLVVGDEAVVSALVDNQTDGELVVAAELALEGVEVVSQAPKTLAVPAHATMRFDWKVRTTRAGAAKVTLVARSDALSDGMTRSLPVHAHGIDAQVARAVRMTGGELAFTLDVPAERRKEDTRFEVQVAPSLAVTMLDALPYLVDYPYGCTEQTMSRFLPAAIVARTLTERGLSAEEAMQRVFGGIEPETAGKTHPKGKKSLEHLAEITRLALERLYDFQRPDGGWGWWKQGDPDRWMTAYVVWGLSLARDAKLDVHLDRIDRGAEWLKKELITAEEEPELQAWMLHAIAAWKKDARESDAVDKAIHNLWDKKERMNAYGRALFALACQGFGRTDRARTMLDVLVNGVRIDETPDVSRIEKNASQHHAATMKTAHWGADSISWRWTDSRVESTASALRALMAIDPKHELVEPVMAWLVQNRRGAQWSNTRDTALTVLALDEYLSKSNELARDVEYELVVNGKSLGKRKLAAKDLLTAPGRFTLEAKDVKDGANEVRVKLLSGSGPLYLSARANFFSLEEPIPARGSQLFAKRQYYAIESRPTLLAGPASDKRPLLDNQTIQSGDRVEVVLTLECKNDLEYLLIEDLKPAGFEAVETKSGQWLTARELKSSEVAYRFSSTPLAAIPDPDDRTRYTNRQRGAHQELRDRKVALFLDRLPQGIWELRYTLRAETPGRFHALPVLGEAMYVPEIRCNGDELRLSVEERATTGG